MSVKKQSKQYIFRLRGRLLPSTGTLAVSLPVALLAVSAPVQGDGESSAPPPAKPGTAAPAAAATLAPPENIGLVIVASEPGTERAAANWSKYDFGTVSLLDVPTVERTFTLRNSGKTPIKLKELKASCGCTAGVIVGKDGRETADTARTPLPTLAPGDETTVRMTVTLTNFPGGGAINKHLTVLVEGQTEPVARYTVAGTIQPCIVFSERILDFGEVKAGAEKAVVRTVTATFDARFLTVAGGKVPTLLSADPTAVRVTPVGEATRTADGKTVICAYRVALAKDAPLGQLLGRLSFEKPASPASLPSAVPAIWERSALGVTGRVAGELTSDPPSARFRNVEQGTGQTVQVTLRGESEAALRGLRLSSESPYVVVHGGSISSDGRAQEVEIILSEKAPDGPLQTQVRAQLANGRTLVIPVLASVHAASGAAAAREMAPLRVGGATPAFTVRDLDSKEHSLSEFRGRPVALTFFCGCEWCYRYAQEWAQLQQAGALPRPAAGSPMPEPLTVVLYQGLEADSARTLAQSAGLDPKRTVLLLDTDEAVTKQYNAEPCPRVFVLDAEGQLVYTNNGTDDAPRKAPESRIIERAEAALEKAVRARPVAGKANSDVAVLRQR